MTETEKPKRGRPRKGEMRPEKLQKCIGRPVLPDPNSSSPIEQLRAKRGLSQKELAALLLVTRPTVGKYERGEVYPKGLVLKALNEMLHKEGLPEIPLR